jgi:Transposase DDE domain
MAQRPRHHKHRPRPSRRSPEERTRRAGRAFCAEQAPKITDFLRLLATAAPNLGRWISLGLALLTMAMLQLWRGARSGNGRLTLCALSRTMPLEENEKARSKRLYRLLRNSSLDGTEMTPFLVRLALGSNPTGWIPIMVDQTDVQGTQVIMAGIRVANRILPVAFTCFAYDQIQKSQNAIENALLLLIAASLPPSCKPLFVMDRGYARASLLTHLRSLGIPFLIRGRSNTLVTVNGKRISLGRLSRRRGQPIRYRNVFYQGTALEPVDIVIFHDPNFQEPWFLLVPPGSEELLPTLDVVDLYRQRMHIELTFRDWKTHLGLRGLSLQVDVPSRLGRLLLALSTAYILVILVGSGPLAAPVRPHCEVLRSTPRHGTRRRLSALSIGILALSLARFAKHVSRFLTQLLAAFVRGRPASEIST